VVSGSYKAIAKDLEEGMHITETPKEKDATNTSTKGK
jgi:hypothetical protein